ncbi:MAG: sulfatase-like hydrolase/transferase [Fuerstiella sp.]|nr:sulfatase-like hydrolase/transferase [Fuerstiella sp.]
MYPRLITTLLTVTICAAAGQLSPVAAAEINARPNILFIMTDQHRWDCVGANGNKLIRTPNFDRLAGEGANFTRAFVNAPVCVPSRASFFTGRYPHSHKNRVNYTPLDRREILMQARLREAGYATASVGKLHLYPPTVAEAKRTGFDFVKLHDAVSSLDRFSDYVVWRKQNDPQADINYRAYAKNVAEGRNPFRAAIDDKYTDTTWVGLRTRDHIRQLAKADKPFFLFSSFWKPHSPFEVPVPFDSMYDDVTIPLPEQQTLKDIARLPLPLRLLILRGRPVYDIDRTRLQWMLRSYYGSISHVDREIGLILKTLEETGQADNTIVVFSSDHGDQLLEHGLTGKNCFFESSIRVPFMLRFPGHVPPGQYDQMIESVDLLPTLFELAGLREPNNSQGRSLVPLITKSDRQYTPRDAVFCENVIPEVITTGRLDFEFVRGKGIKGVRHPDARMVRTSQWKFNYYPNGDAELYDLKNDPAEMHNLHGQSEHREIEAELKDRLLHFLVTIDETDQIAPRWLRPK